MCRGLLRVCILVYNLCYVDMHISMLLHISDSMNVISPFIFNVSIFYSVAKGAKCPPDKTVCFKYDTSLSDSL